MIPKFGSLNPHEIAHERMKDLLDITSILLHTVLKCYGIINKIYFSVERENHYAGR